MVGGTGSSTFHRLCRPLRNHSATWPHLEGQALSTTVFSMKAEIGTGKLGSPLHKRSQYRLNGGCGGLVALLE